MKNNKIIIIVTFLGKSTDLEISFFDHTIKIK